MYFLSYLSHWQKATQALESNRSITPHLSLSLPTHVVHKIATQESYKSRNEMASLNINCIPENVQFSHSLSTYFPIKRSLHLTDLLAILGIKCIICMINIEKS